MKIAHNKRLSNTPAAAQSVANPVPKLKLSAIATACALAFTSAAFAQTNGTVVIDATDLLTANATQSLNAFGYEMRLLSAQNNSAVIAAEVLSNTLTASFASGPDAALTISGNSVSAATLGNQATNSADLGLLGSGINPFAIAAANSQLRNTGASTATVDNQLIEARSVDSQFAPTTISGNSVSASVGLNNASTRVAGTPARAFNSEEPVGTTLANNATLVIASANIAVVNAQTASNASGNAGSRAAVTQSTIVASATGAPSDGSNALSEAVTISNNAIAAGFASNTATTVYESTPGSAAFKGGVIVANVQTDIETAPQTEAPTALIQNASITADVRQLGGTNVLAAPVTISGNRMVASSSGNRAGELDATGRVLAGNALIIESASSVSSNLDSSSLSVGSLQQASGTRYASTIEGSNLSALVDNTAAGGSVTLRDNSLVASSNANLAGNLASITADAIASNLSVSNEQSTIQTVVNSLVTGSSVSTRIDGETLNSAGAVTLSGNQILATADANIAANTLVQNASAVSGRIDSLNIQSITDSTVRAELFDSNAKTKVEAPDVDSIAITNSRNNLAAIANGNTFTGTTSVQARQLGTAQTGISNFTQSSQNATNLQLSAEASGEVASEVSGNLTNSRLTVTDNSISSAAVGNRSSQLADLVTTNFSNQQSSVESTQIVSGTISATTTALTSLVVSPVSNVSGSSLTASGNSIQSQAIGNTGSNVLAVSATSASGSGGSFNVNNSQRGEGGVSALSTGSQEILAGGQIDNSSITLSNNSISAAALGQSASNRLQITTSSLSGSTSNVFNAQERTGGDVSASVVAATGHTSGATLFGVSTDGASSSPITVSGNRAEASAMQNDAVNVLQATATSLVVPSVSPAMVVDNQQVSTGGSYASVSYGQLGLTANSLSSGNAVVSDNRVTASAGVNTATNAIVVDATSALNAIGNVNSNQVASGAVDASIGSPMLTTLGVIAPFNAGIALNSINATVSGNLMVAQGTANAATNILNALSSNPIGNAEVVAPAATYALNSQQNSSGQISARVNNAQLGVVGAAVDSSTLTISGNTIAALSTANTASNQMTLSAMPGSAMQASSSLTNTQTSTSAVSAQVSGVTVIAGAGASTQPGASRTATVSGNTVAAQATGNTAVNQITRR